MAKEILKEEKLDDEQLEKVAGGISDWHFTEKNDATDGNQNTNPATNQLGVRITPAR